MNIPVDLTLPAILGFLSVAPTSVTGAFPIFNRGRKNTLLSNDQVPDEAANGVTRAWHDDVFDIGADERGDIMFKYPLDLHAAKGDDALRADGHNRIREIREDESLPSQSGIVLGHLLDEGLLACPGGARRLAVGQAFSMALFFFTAHLAQKEGNCLWDGLLCYTELFDMNLWSHFFVRKVFRPFARST